MTTLEVCETGLRILLDNFYPYFILDVNAGTGVWGKALKRIQSNNFLTGVETKNIQKPEEYDKWIIKDFLEFDTGLEFDLIMGSPPYESAEQYLDRSFELVRTNGFILFLLKLSFLESICNDHLNPKEVWISTRKVNFHNDIQDTFGIFIWEKGYIGDTTLCWFDFGYVK